MKKNLFVFASAAIVAMLTSCSGSGLDPKNITPTATEFSSGEVARYVEIVDQPAELKYTENDDNQYIRLKVTLKMVQDGIKNADARDISFIHSFGIMDVELIDENETTVQSLSLKSEDRLKFQKFLTGNEGDTGEFVFETFYGNQEMARENFKDAVRFTPSLTSDIAVGDEIYTTVSDSDSDDEEVSSDGEDWDSLLDSYEESVDSYISMLKKVSAGDISAMSESASFLQKSQELTKKLSGATSGMSVSQVNRFNEINQKMLQAAQDMN